MEQSAEKRHMMLVFRIEEQRYALGLDTVERVIRAVAVTSVPEAPPFILGLVNIAGQVLSVVSLRACLGLPVRPLRPEDQFVIVRTSRCALALAVDEVRELRVIDAAQTIAAEEVLPKGQWKVQGLVNIEDDIVLIYDLEVLLNQGDQFSLLQAAGGAEGAVPI